MFAETPRKRFRDKVDLPIIRRRKKWLWIMEVSRLRVRIKRRIARGLGRRGSTLTIPKRTYEQIND